MVAYGSPGSQKERRICRQIVGSPVLITGGAKEDVIAGKTDIACAEISVRDQVLSDGSVTEENEADYHKQPLTDAAEHGHFSFPPPSILASACHAARTRGIAAD